MHVRPTECKAFIQQAKEANKLRLGYNNKKIQQVPEEILRKAQL